MTTPTLPGPMTPQIAQAYADTMSNLAFIKQQQWTVTNYVVLLIAAIFALHGRASAGSLCVMYGLVCVTAGYGMYLLMKMQAGLLKFRRRMAAINGRYFSQDERDWLAISDKPKSMFHDVGFLIGLSAVIILAAGLALWAMSSPAPSDQPFIELKIG